MLITRIDHVGIAVTNLDDAVEHYRTTFGLTVVDVATNAEQGVREAMLRVGEPGALSEPGEAGASEAGASEVAAGGLASYVQLLEPLGPDTPVGRFLAKRGEGIHHIGYAVDDISLAMRSLVAQGIRLLDERPRHGSLGASIAFAHPKDLNGVLTELVQAARG